MNKRSLFTIASVLTVCAIIVWSCEKEDKTAKKVYYNTQPGYGTGGNPNPNGVATSGGSAVSSSSSSASSSSGTASASSGGTCANAITSNGTPATSVAANGGLGTGGTYVVNHNGSIATTVITFATTSAPPSGTYAIVNATPGPGQCSFADYGTNAVGGSITVTSPATGAANGKITYTGIVCGTYTNTGVACY